MQAEKIIIEYWRDWPRNEFRKLHKPSCLLLPEIRRSNEHWLEECSLAEALILYSGSPGVTKCDRCLPEAL